MIKSTDINDDIHCPLLETSVMFDATVKGKIWTVKSISLSRKGFRIYDSNEDGPVLVKKFFGKYEVFGNYIKLADDTSIEIIAGFNDLITLETLIGCHNSKSLKEIFNYSNPNLYVP